MAPPKTWWDVPANVIQNLLEAHDAERGFFSYKTFEQRLYELRTSLSSVARKVAAQIVAGTATIERTERWMYATIDTEGLASSDQLIAIDGDGWADYDMLAIEQADPGRIVNIPDPSGGIGTIFTMQGACSLDRTHGGAKFSVLMRFAGGWHEVMRYPHPYVKHQVDSTISLASREVTVMAGAVAITGSNMVVYGEASGEVLAEASAGVSAAGDDGDTLTITVSEGIGNFVIGSYTKQAGDDESAIVTGVLTSINDPGNLHGYTASDNLDQSFQVIAPVGSGSAANSYSIQVYGSGNMGAVAIIPVFAGGVDGTPGADTIDTASGMEPGQVFIIQNGNASGDLTISTAGNFDIPSPHVLAPGDIVLCAEQNGNARMIRNGGQGPQGNLLYFGDGKPSDGTGSNGDYYLDTLKGWLYQKSSGAYGFSRVMLWWERELMVTSGGISGRNSAGATVGTFTFTPDSYGMWGIYQTASGAGNQASVNMAAWARADHHPEAVFFFKSPEAMTSMRLYIGLTSNGTGFGNTDTPAGEYLAMRFLTTASDTKWTFVMKGTGSQVSSVTSVTPAGSTGYILVLRYDPSDDKGYCHVYDWDMVLLATATLSGSAMTDSSQLRSEISLWSQTTGAGGQRTIGLHKLGGRVRK